MAASRSKRANAGCRMKEVMEKADADPFYDSLYGGFYDEENDADFKCSAKVVKTGENTAEQGLSSDGGSSEEEEDGDSESGSGEDEEEEDEYGAGSSRATDGDANCSKDVGNALSESTVDGCGNLQNGAESVQSSQLHSKVMSSDDHEVSNVRDSVISEATPSKEDDLSSSQAQSQNSKSNNCTSKDSSIEKKRCSDDIIEHESENNSSPKRLRTESLEKS